jgi:hypothetical protein
MTTTDKIWRLLGMLWVQRMLEPNCPVLKRAEQRLYAAHLATRSAA